MLFDLYVVCTGKWGGSCSVYGPNLKRGVIVPQADEKLLAAARAKTQTLKPPGCGLGFWVLGVLEVLGFRGL